MNTEEIIIVEEQSIEEIEVEEKIEYVVGQEQDPTVPEYVKNITQSDIDNWDTVTNKANSVDLESHTSNQNIHVTSEEKSNWDNKSDFGGSYNDLSDKPNIPTKTSDLTNDNNFTTNEYVDSAISTAIGSALLENY